MTMPSKLFADDAATRGAGYLRAMMGLAAVLAGGCQAGGAAGTPPSSGDTETGGSSGDAAQSDSGSDTAAEPGACASSQAVARAPLRRLSRSMLASAITDLLGVAADVDALPPDEKLGPFDANVVAPVSEVAVDDYAEIAEDVAAQLDGEQLEALAQGCSQTACVPDLVAAFGLRAFRRPLVDDEITQYAGLHAVGAADGFAEGTRLVVEAMLQSPSFLYMVETRGAEAFTAETVYLLDAYATATRLSFFLWGSTPSDDLLAAAANGELADRDGLSARALEMYADPRADAAVAAFHLQWLELDALAESTKSEEIIAVWDTALINAMQAETASFANHVLREDDGRLATLLTAGYSLPSPELYELYGIDAQSVDDDGVALLPEQRAGLLTQPSVLARHSNPDHSSPILRGLLVRENLLCQTLPSPPPGAADNPPVPEPGATTRALFEQHTSDPTCAACHTLMDPIGFGFEDFDPVGRFRTDEDGLAIDDRGELVGTDVDGEFTGVRELAERLAGSDDVKQCVATQWFRFGLGREASDDDACSVDTIRAAFVADDGDIESLVLGIVDSDAFRYARFTP
jgi:Protein of unknown function (DUF1588)/Protein of unknown function (DUF1592)/Protein of unknown function (DUF1585)/Protein of unknown function (DUF1595)/Protein of unknown function (DUF1587)